MTMMGCADLVYLHARSARRNDQALVGDDDPAAVLAPDLLDAARARRRGGPLGLDDALAALDQGDAVVAPAHHVVFDDRGLRLRLRGRRAHRPGDVALPMGRRHAGAAF